MRPRKLRFAVDRQTSPSASIPPSPAHAPQPGLVTMPPLSNNVFSTPEFIASSMICFEPGVVQKHKLTFVLDRHASIAPMVSQTIDDLPTPALILDRAILDRNCKRMSERLRNAGVMLRPHVKTAKSLQVGRKAVEGHDGRITVSTLAEARRSARPA